MKTTRGSASIELLAVAPVIAAFVLVIFQFTAFFHGQIDAVADAGAKAKTMVAEWDAHQSGFDRPCLEKMPQQAVIAGGEKMPIGSGAWKKELSVVQEVKIVSEPVCANW